jgi:hypothetical protein
VRKIESGNKTGTLLILVCVWWLVDIFLLSFLDEFYSLLNYHTVTPFIFQVIRIYIPARTISRAWCGLCWLPVVLWLMRLVDVCVQFFLRFLFVNFLKSVASVCRCVGFNFYPLFRVKFDFSSVLFVILGFQAAWESGSCNTR